MIKTLGIRAKLLLLVALVQLGLVVVAGVGLWGMGTIHSGEERLVGGGFEPSRKVLQVQRELHRLRGNAYKMLLLHPQGLEASSREVEACMGRIDTLSTGLGSGPSQADDSLAALAQGFSSGWKVYRSHVGSVVRLANQGQVDSCKELIRSPQLAKARGHIDSLTEAMIAHLDREVRERVSSDKGSLVAMRWFFAILVAVFLVVGVAGGYALTGRIVKAIKEMEELVEAMGSGDFRDRALVSEGNDELAHMQQKLRFMGRRLRTTLKGVRGSSVQLDEDAKVQRDEARRLAEIADRNEGLVHAVSESSQQTAGNLESIADGAKRSVETFGTLSASVEEMTSSIGEIARSAEQTRVLSREASSGAQSATSSMQELARASEEIETVVESIVEISEQTKLLALNATIEAARAGEAGKGFAVVAGEVKELAKAAAQASETIRERVEAIRQTTRKTVGDIDRVSMSMRDLDGSFSAIASAVEEQSATTREIAGSLNEALATTSEVTRAMVGSEAAVARINREIATMKEMGEQLRNASLELNRLAESTQGSSAKMGAEIAKFQV